MAVNLNLIVCFTKQFNFVIYVYNVHKVYLLVQDVVIEFVINVIKNLKMMIFLMFVLYVKRDCG